MTTREQRAKLPDPGEVEALFDKPTITRLAAIARIPDDRADNMFGSSVRVSVSNYLSDAKGGLQAGEVRAAISALYRCIEDVIEGKVGAVETVAGMLESLPPAVAKFLQGLARGAGENIPSPGDVRDPVHGRARLQMLGALCASGSFVKEGRKRPGGKQSRPTVSVETRSPKPHRGPPENTEEFILCASLGGIFANCTGKPPFRPKYEDRRSQDHLNPFGAFVREVFALVGIAGGTDDLVRKYIAALKITNT